MDWIVYKEEPAVLERSGPFAITEKSQEVYWDLHERDGVVKLGQIDSYHYNPEYTQLDDRQKYWVYEFTESAFLEHVTDDRKMSIGRFFAEANKYTNTDWRLLAEKVELAPKIARFNINRKQRNYIGSGQFESRSLDITIISDQINQTLSLRTIDGTLASIYELEQADINRALVSLNAEIVADLHLHLQNQDFDYWAFLAELLINEGEIAVLDPNDTRWDSNNWLR